MLYERETPAERRRNIPARELVARVVDETIAVAKTQSVTLSAERVDAALENAYTYAGEHKTSMLQDREARRRTEADYIGGAIVRLGEQSGIFAPVLNALTTLAAAPIRQHNPRSASAG